MNFIWVKKKRKVITIRIVNILNLKNEEEKINKLSEIYKNVASENYGEMEIDKKKGKVELNIVI